MDVSILETLYDNATTVTKTIGLLLKHNRSSYEHVDGLEPFYVALLSLLPDHMLVYKHEEIMYTVYRDNDQLLGFSVFAGIPFGRVGVSDTYALEVHTTGITIQYTLPALIRFLPFEWDLFKAIPNDLVTAEYEKAHNITPFNPINN